MKTYDSALTIKSKCRSVIIVKIVNLAFLTVLLFVSSTAYSQKNDWRNLENAVSEIPDENYCDQPYVVINKKGEWVVVMTTGAGGEGNPGQHVVATIGVFGGHITDFRGTDGCNS